MRSHCAVYVDAGYLRASATTRVTGTSLRSGVEVDHGRLIQAMIDQAETASGLPLLRVNWYDSGAKPGGVPDWTRTDRPSYRESSSGSADLATQASKKASTCGSALETAQPRNAPARTSVRGHPRSRPGTCRGST